MKNVSSAGFFGGKPKSSDEHLGITFMLIASNLSNTALHLMWYNKNKLTPDMHTCRPLLHSVRSALGVGAGQVTFFPLRKRQRNTAPTSVQKKIRL